MPTKIHTDNWNNVPERHRNGTLARSGYSLLSQERLDSIKPSDTVKIGNGVELFWVLVTEIKDGRIYGTVDNHLGFDHNKRRYAVPYNRGDTVMFSKENVYDIHTQEWRMNEAIRMLQNKSALKSLTQILVSAGMNQSEASKIIDSAMTVVR